MSLLKKEIISLFSSLGFYLIGFIFSIGCALFLFFFSGEFNVFELNQANLYPFFQITPYFLIILIPALSMRSFAEEKEKGTFDWLKTMPISMNQIIIAKFIAILVGFIFIISLSLSFYFIINYFSLDGIDIGLIFSSYLGLFLLGTLLSAIGVFCSAINTNQITTYICSVLLGSFFFLFFSGLADYNLVGNFDFITKNLSSQFHYERFTQGIFHISSFIYFSCLSFLFLFLIKLKFKR